jgi:hypothetical protein
MRVVRLTDIDSKLPNLALMKLAHYHREQGDEVYLTRSVERDFFEPEPDIVYGSAIFEDSADLVARLKTSFPTAFVSGTGVDERGGVTVEEMIGVELWQYERYDYSIYPDFRASIGFSQRGCRLDCEFCGVRGKEGKPASVNDIEAIWRGPGHPKKLHLLDNDFFGQPDWRGKIAAIRDGGFKVCMSQGINVRLIDDEAAAALASIEYRDTSFSERRLYTAWDNIGHEKIFFRGVDRLERAGIKPEQLMVYMLVGFDKAETWERIWYRFNRMVARGIRPFAMVFDKRHAKADLICWQRWVNKGIYRFKPWDLYIRETKSQESVDAYMAAVAT